MCILPVACRQCAVYERDVNEGTGILYFMVNLFYHKILMIQEEPSKKW